MREQVTVPVFLNRSKVMMVGSPGGVPSRKSATGSDHAPGARTIELPDTACNTDRYGGGNAELADMIGRVPDAAEYPRELETLCWDELRALAA